MPDTYLPHPYSKRILTDKQISLLDNLDTAGYDPYRAAELAGYADPKSAVRSVSKELVEIVETMIATDALIAAKTLGDILRSSTPILNVKEKAAAANSILDRAGHAKKEILDVTHRVTGGVFVLPAKKELKEVLGETLEGEVDEG